MQLVHAQSGSGGLEDETCAVGDMIEIGIKQKLDFETAPGGWTRPLSVANIAPTPTSPKSGDFAV